MPREIGFSANNKASKLAWKLLTILAPRGMVANASIVLSEKFIALKQSYILW